jgi:hypothetical protein
MNWYVARAELNEKLLQGEKPKLANITGGFNLFTLKNILLLRNNMQKIIKYSYFTLLKIKFTRSFFIHIKY